MIIELLKLFLGYKIMFLNTWRGRYSLMPRVRTRVNPKKNFWALNLIITQSCSKTLVLSQIP